MGTNTFPLKVIFWILPAPLFYNKLYQIYFF